MNGCCTSCKGSGATLSGPCTDCLGTGHTHAGPCVPLTTCRSCPAVIFWVVTVNHKKMPVDAEPTPYGNLILIDPIPGDPDYMAVNKSAGSDQLGYTSHFATCPAAASRRAKR